MDQSKADYDTRLYDVCRPWRGKRGDAYSVTFRPAFLNGLLKFTDDWSSLREHALGTDYGGPAGPPHPGGASGLTSLRAWGNRAQKLRHKVWLHCEDEAVRAMIDEACDQLAAHLAGGAAAPAAPSLWLAGCSQGQLALAVLDSAGTHPDTGLSVSLRNKKWEGLSLRQLAISPETILNLQMVINRTNAERPVGTERYTADQCRLKFLQLIDHPTALADKAVAEMQRCSYVTATGANDYAATVKAFDELWRTYFDRGDIKPSARAADSSAGARGNRVDGMELQANALSAESEDILQHIAAAGFETQQDVGGNLFVTTPTGRRLMICFNCKGIGHGTRQCPSKAKTTLTDALAALQQANDSGRDLEGESHGGSRMTPRFRKGRGGGRWSSRGRGGYSQPSRNTYAVECDDEGTVYDPATGEEWGSLASPQPPPLPSSEAMPRESASQSVTIEGNADIASLVNETTPDARTFVEAARNEPSATKLVWSGADMLCSLAENRESAPLPSGERDSGSLAKHRESAPLPRGECDSGRVAGDDGSSVLKLMSRALCGVLAIAMATIAAVPDLAMRGRRMLLIGPATILILLLALGCAGAASTDLDATRPMHEPYIGHDALRALESSMTAPKAKARPYCNMDTGTSRPASGRRKLFPTALITDMNPSISVRVASGSRMAVKFVGVAVLRLKEPVSICDDGKFVYNLGMVEAFYVPGMPEETMLASPGTLFRIQGTRVYFNDACYIDFPSGYRVRFEQNELGYFLPFDSSLDMTNLEPKDVYIPMGQTSFAARALHALQSLPGFVSLLTERLTMAIDRNLCPTVDVIHNRLCHAGWDRIGASQGCTRGLDLSGVQRQGCRSCDVGGTTRKAEPPSGHLRQRKFTRFGERVCSDQCAMPKSTPFGFENWLVFYDVGTKTIELYYTKGHTDEEIRQCFLQFCADYKEDLLWCNGTPLEWAVDNHGEFVSSDMDEFLAHMRTKQISIVPWNPQQNPAERVNGMILRPLRICLAHGDATVRVWPFLTNQIKMVLNSLANRSRTASLAGRSAYEMRTGRVPDLSPLRVPLCRMLAHVRAERDLLAMGKLAPRNVECVHLCYDDKRHGYMAYVLEHQRLTTFRRQECIFYEDEFPRVSWIVGTMLTEHGITKLPSMAQQEADATRYRRELEVNMRDTPRPRIDTPDNELEDPDAIPDGPTEASGPPSRRTRSRAGASELAEWNSLSTVSYTHLTLPTSDLV